MDTAEDTTCDDISREQQLLFDFIKEGRDKLGSSSDDSDNSDLAEDVAVSCRSPGEQLLRAAERGDNTAVNQILSTHADSLHYTDPDGYTALHRASYNGHTDTVQLLLRRGHPSDARTCDGWQPLHSAARWNQLHCCRLLVDLGSASVNATTNGGHTPLHLAATNRDAHRLIAFLLARREIDVSVRNQAGDTALDIARRTGDVCYLFKAVSATLNI